jgi:hypothetical protein
LRDEIHYLEESSSKKSKKKWCELLAQSPSMGVTIQIYVWTIK